MKTKESTYKPIILIKSFGVYDPDFKADSMHVFDCNWDWDSTPEIVRVEAETYFSLN